jgi:hypothetical protein
MRHNKVVFARFLTPQEGFADGASRSSIASMLGKLTRTMRRTAAIYLAVFYAFVMLAPHAALALNAGGVFHCINDMTANVASSHDHGATAKHHTHDKADMDHDHAGKTADRDATAAPAACCGLFSVAGLTTDLRAEFGVEPRMSATLPISSEWHDGEGPGNITKPPRA